MQKKYYEEFIPYSAKLSPVENFRGFRISPFIREFFTREKLKPKPLEIVVVVWGNLQRRFNH